MLPDDITTTDAHNLAADNAPSWLDSVRYFVGTHEDLDGDVDHWQEGEGFSGPKPAEGDSARNAYMDALEKVFVVEDVISEVLSRRQGAVLGLPPMIDVKPPDEEEMEDEAEDESEDTPAEKTAEILRDWWERQNLTDTLSKGLKRVSSEEQVLLRMVIDPGRIDESGQISGLDSIEESLDTLRIEVIGRDQGLVHEDLRTKKKTGLIAFEKTEEGSGDQVDYIEKTWVNENGETELSIEYEDGVEPTERGSFNLNGNLLHYQLEHELLVSESLRSNQKTLNTTRTMINITGQQAGFPELHLVDIETPKDEDGNEQTPERGPGKIKYHVSVPKKTEGPSGQTQERQGSADVMETDPVDNESLREDAQVARRSIYRDAHQLHVFLGDEDASGRSRVQARHDFVQDVEDVGEVLNRGGTWILETAYALANELLGRQPGEFIPPSEADVDFECRIDPGPVTPEEQKEIRKALEDDLMSLRTAMLKYGIDDPDAELERIKEDKERTKTRRDELEEQRLETNIEENSEIARRRREIENGTGE